MDVLAQRALAGGAGTRSRRRSWCRTLAMVGIAGALLFGHVTAAEAVTPDDPAAAPVTEPAVAGSATAAVTLSPAGNLCQDPPCGTRPVISCWLRVDTPFRVATQAWTIGDLWCTHPVSEIHLTVALLKNGSSVSIRQRHAYGADSATADGVKSCTWAYYQGVASATVVPPPGYYPTSASATVVSPTVQIVHPQCV